MRDKSLLMTSLHCWSSKIPSFLSLNKNVSINNGTFVWNGRSARAYSHIHFEFHYVWRREGASFLLATLSLWRECRRSSWKSTKLILMSMTSDSQEREKTNGERERERERKNRNGSFVATVFVLFLLRWLDFALDQRLVQSLSSALLRSGIISENLIL